MISLSGRKTVQLRPLGNRVPGSRSKQASILHGQYLYLLGGRNGNVPLKDFWRYNIGENDIFYKLFLCYNVRAKFAFRVVYIPVIESFFYDK